MTICLYFIGILVTAPWWWLHRRPKHVDG